MRAGNWLVFFQAAEGAPMLNAYVRAESAEQAIEGVRKWEPPVIAHGALSPDLQNELHLS